MEGKLIRRLLAQSLGMIISPDISYEMQHAPQTHVILKSDSGDLGFVVTLFASAADYQKRHGYPVWSSFDEEVLASDISLGRQYKIMIGNEIAMIFSVLYSDPIIWRERNAQPAIYLHRIVVNQKYKGQKLFGRVLDWAQQEARERGLECIRMDTWGDNPGMIAYYQSFGFVFLEYYLTPDTEELPRQNRNLLLALLEMKA